MGIVKTFNEFINEEFIHEDEDDRKHLIDIVKRTVRSERTAEILLSYFGLYKDENGEYLNPKTIDELAYRYGLSDSQIKNIINKGITKLKQAFVDKPVKSYTSMPKKGLRRQLWLRDQIMDKDREYIYDLLNAMNNREEISDEDIEDMRSVDANDMGSIRNDLYYEEMTELKSILAKIDKGSIEDYEEESYGVFVNIKTDSRYKVFLDDQKDEAEDFVANNEDVLSDVMDYPYKYKGYEKHFYIVMLDSKE